MDSDYTRLSEAVADIMFGSGQAGRPVYALPDAETVREILEAAEIEDRTLVGLSTIVKSSLQLGEPGVAPFYWQGEAARRHRHQPLETPSALPLLVVFSIAAEQMQADGDHAAHNYYSRLHRILQVPTSEYLRVENDYRRVADLLWGSLNAWLEAWDGERGIPTAYAVGGHAFIGLPMSQAVVRQHDRAGLHELFAVEGMTPGLRISPEDMSLAMDPYATATPSLPLSSHLAQLWRVSAARDRIIDAACLELEAWDGSGVEAFASARPVATTRLLAFVRTFPRKSIEFNLMLPYRSQGPDIARFKLEDEEEVVPTISGPGGSTRLSGVEGISGASLVGEQLTGEFGDDDSRPFGRRPKRVISLRWDDLQGAYVEIEHIPLAEDSIVLARSDARKRVEAHLAVHARPGWHELAELPGTPEGWLVYKQVQIVSAPMGQVHFDLLPLVPRTRTSLTLRGGFVIPGLLRKWSVMEPPEAVALVAGASSIDVRLYRGTRIDPAALVAESSQPGELAVLPLAHRDLSDGEYVVAMFVDDKTKPSSTALLRLRSARTPQFRVDDVDIRLVYSPDSSPRWPLTAGPADWPDHVNGARTVGLESLGDEAARPMSEFVPRERSDSNPELTKTRVGLPVASDSCLVTGMHRFLLPPVLPGQTPTRSIKGECATCGLVRRFAGTPWAAKKKDVAAKIVVLPESPPLIEADESDFDVAFDALNHVGAGSFGVFERIAAQIDGSELFADSFLRQLEVVGHVDAVRDAFLRVTEWAVNKSTLVPMGDRRWILIGSRSDDLLGRLRGLVGSRAVVSTSVDAALTRVEVAGDLPVAALDKAGIAVLDASPAKVIAEALPPLSELAKALKRVIVPVYRSVDFWDTASASWHRTESLARVGAYRLRHYGSTYAIRTADDIASGTIGLGNAQIVKHIANLWANDPLVGYNSRSGSVITPLGADLPALYGRALALCSGRAPREFVNHRMLQYPSVPRAVADVIFNRVSR
ncbi:hypothetical protein SAMN04489806_1356 [Paramicrobacterium humi]|uniref:Uncharacterized protein n=1 Tax=Paramicrobacterium humi TaxID=640635 RepID=A0A1H4KZE6_9MICO|nr:hypothetical protein [Microbacterium humi]SEB63465.1 hypothetical protein SAMN04489806_1356 [Microbacterium humi]